MIGYSPMARWRGFYNPFYALLVMTGIAFCLTAFAYGVMTVQGLHGVDPGQMSQAGVWLNDRLDRHGVTVLGIELAVLAVCTVAAIGTDAWWTRRADDHSTATRYKGSLMKVQATTDVEQKPVQMEGAAGCQVRWLIGADDGAPTFAMREFHVEPGGYTPRHQHAYEHEVYVLEGEGEVFEGNVAHPLRAGDVVLVQPDEVHQFRNTGHTTMRFLCLIPNAATGQQVTVVPECGAETTSR